MWIRLRIISRCQQMAATCLCAKHDGKKINCVSCISGLSSTCYYYRLISRSTFIPECIDLWCHFISNIPSNVIVYSIIVCSSDYKSKSDIFPTQHFSLMTLQPYGPGIINLKVPRQGEGVCDKNTVVQRLEGGVDINIYCFSGRWMTTEQGGWSIGNGSSLLGPLKLNLLSPPGRNLFTHTAYMPSIVL